jgi:hypothetical protein
MAIEAGLVDPQEVEVSNKAMSGIDESVSLHRPDIYPPYLGFFQNKGFIRMDIRTEGTGLVLGTNDRQLIDMALEEAYDEINPCWRG